MASHIQRTPSVSHHSHYDQRGTKLYSNQAQSVTATIKEAHHQKGTCTLAHGTVHSDTLADLGTPSEGLHAIINPARHGKRVQRTFQVVSVADVGPLRDLLLCPVVICCLHTYSIGPGGCECLTCSSQGYGDQQGQKSP